MSELAKALVEALTDLTVIEKGKTASIPTKSGGSYSYSYADLAAIVSETRPILAGKGLTALTPVSGREGGLQVQVILLHASGERLDFAPLFFQASNDPQAAGSSMTYYRRYALLAALGIATGEDDDGAAGANHAHRDPAPAPVSTKVCGVCDEPLSGKAVKYGSGFAHEACAAGERPMEETG